MERKALKGPRLKALPTARSVRFSWPAMLWYVLINVCAVSLAIPFFSWRSFGAYIVLYFLLGTAVTLGAHRYFSHRSFDAPIWFENILAVLYTLSFNRGGQPLISWCASHIFHHAYADKDLDPHSPIHGFWHAFCGHFIFRRQDLYRFEDYRLYCPKLASKPFLVWLEKNIIWIQATWISLVFLSGGITSPKAGFDWHGAIGFVVYGVFIRGAVAQLAASFVDTWSHGVGIFAYLPDTWNTKTHAKNNLFYWTMTFGNETWHNFHHAFPRSARNGERWYHWDLDSALMKGMDRLGLVKIRD